MEHVYWTSCLIKWIKNRIYLNSKIESLLTSFCMDLIKIRFIYNSVFNLQLWSRYFHLPIPNGHFSFKLQPIMTMCFVLPSSMTSEIVWLETSPVYFTAAYVTNYMNNFSILICTQTRTLTNVDSLPMQLYNLL